MPLSLLSTFYFLYLCSDSATIDSVSWLFNPYLTMVSSDSVSIKTGEPPIPKYLSKKAFSNYVVFDLPNRAYGAISLIDLTLSYL